MFFCLWDEQDNVTDCHIDNPVLQNVVFWTFKFIYHPLSPFLMCPELSSVATGEEQDNSPVADNETNWGSAYCTRIIWATSTWSTVDPEISIK